MREKIESGDFDVSEERKFSHFRFYNPILSREEILEITDDRAEMKKRI